MYTGSWLNCLKTRHRFLSSLLNFKQSLPPQHSHPWLISIIQKLHYYGHFTWSKNAAGYGHPCNEDPWQCPSRVSIRKVKTVLKNFEICSGRLRYWFRRVLLGTCRRLEMKMLAGIIKEEQRRNLELCIAYHLSSHPSVVDECHLVRSSRWSDVFPKHSS